LQYQLPEGFESVVFTVTNKRTSTKILIPSKSGGSKSYLEASPEDTADYIATLVKTTYPIFETTRGLTLASVRFTLLEAAFKVAISKHNYLLGGEAWPVSP